MQLGQKDRRGLCFCLIFLMLASISMPLTSSAFSTRSTTVWSGNVTLSDGYIVGAQEVLIVQAGTTIQLGADEEITVDGRINVQGTLTSPVLLESIIGKHDGIVFNQSSQGLGSSINNLTIVDAEYGISIYGSDPIISDVVVNNADRVAVDIFDGSTAEINNLTINGGGQDLHGSTTHWRYGFGLSVGANSAPVVNGLIADGLITRALNYWGNSGGLISNLEISNISGATVGIATGIWVEDSIPLIMDVEINRCDNGIFVRHITSGWTTRPTFERVVIENSMYRGVMVEQYNHSMFSNIPANAVFEDLTVRGTGGPDAKTSGLGFAAFELNTSGVIIENALIENNPVVGFKAYLIGSSTIINDLNLNDNGNPSQSSSSANRAGFYMRSVNWAPTVNNLVVTNSSGPGVMMSKGGAIGHNWHIADNAGNGVELLEFHPSINNLTSFNNLKNGVSIRDSSNVELANITTSGNGIGATTAESGAGLYFEEANDIMSGGKNISCNNCVSNNDQFGIIVRDSIDLQLISVEINNPNFGSALDIDNTGLTRDGFIIIDDLSIHQNSSEYAIQMNDVNAFINQINSSGDNSGIYWSGGDSMTSTLSNSTISGNVDSCIEIVNHEELLISNLEMLCATGLKPSIDSSNVNFTNSEFFIGSGYESSFHMIEDSHLRWISSDSMGIPSFDSTSNIIDVMWFVEIHAINHMLNHIPNAEVNLSFESYESPENGSLSYYGKETFGPYVGARWLPSQGWSSDNIVNVGCDYDSVHNDSAAVTLDQDRVVYCRLELTNQPPFIIWTTPEDESVYPSGSTVTFNATESWDLDIDNLIYSWTSSIDGDLLSSCAWSSISNNSIFYANLEGNSICLSDGSHQITLEVCDIHSNCAIETRTITLFNQPPSLSVETSPGISSWGIMHLGITANATISLEGSSDPENDPLTCWIETSYGFSTPDNQGCSMLFDTNFPGAPTEFRITIHLSDGVNPDVTSPINVRLFNEVPVAEFEVVRANDFSSSAVTLDGTMVTDPEGDEIRFEFWSDIDGLLISSYTPDESVEWNGWLSKGLHTITMFASDDLSSHQNSWTSSEMIINVNNSKPVALISEPFNNTQTDSGTLIRFDATGSGDWDVSCTEIPDNGSGFICNPTSTISRDLVSVIWESDSLSEPFASGWVVEERLPKGIHNITLTIDDGSGQPSSDTITLQVDEAAPILILASPVPDAQELSNSPVLFDFRDSFDPEGDSFTVTVSSNLMSTPILKDKTTESLFTEYIPHGEHELTFELRDSTGRVSTYTQMLTVMQTGPIAEINGLMDGQYVPPGTKITLDASTSYDYDNDIVLYQWFSNSLNLLGDKQIIEVMFEPGITRVDLLVKDSRGIISTASVNLTIGSSSPTISDLQISPDFINSDEPTSMLITVVLDDPDGTTQTISGLMASAGDEMSLEFHDDGMEGDETAGDNIWTYRGLWLLSDSKWAHVEVWAIDGEMVSPLLIENVNIVEPEDNNLISWISGSGLPFFILLLVLVSLIGVTVQKQRMDSIKRDIEMIESWSAFDIRELDDENK